MNLHNLSIDIFKGFAIIGVIIIHVVGIAFSFTPIATSAGQALLLLDQLARFCVPIFVAISGYTLAKSYQQSTKKIVSFYEKRALRLLPQYLFISLISYVIISYLGKWPNYQRDFPLWKAIILGKADYHLYFVPMIFQLYLLFPLLYNLVKKWPNLTTILFLMFQIFFYAFLSIPNLSRMTSYFGSDQGQYLFFGTWIFYFILGIYFSLEENKIINKIPKYIFIFAGFFIFLAYLQSKYIVGQNYDLVVATRSTKITILFYATSFIFLFFKFKNKLENSNIIFRLIALLGRQSWGIYLIHVMILRILIDYFFLEKNLANLVKIFFIDLGISYLLAIGLSKMERKIVNFKFLSQKSFNISPPPRLTS